jgi:hypothetical protein
MALYFQEGYRRLERRALERAVEMADTVVLTDAGLSSAADTLRLIELSFAPETFLECRTMVSWFSDAFFVTPFWFGFVAPGSKKRT